MKIVEIKTYQYDELSDEAKKKALEGMHNLNVDHEWWDFVYEDAKEIGKLMGIEIENIYFRGFWSQGDGACFEGSYEYAKGAVKKVEEYAPKDTVLHELAKRLQEIQKPHFYLLCATVKQSGHYNHSGCTDVNVETREGEWVNADVHDELTQVLREYMDWIYRKLEAEHEYLTSEESVVESIKANEYAFTENGGGKVYI